MYSYATCKYLECNNTFYYNKKKSPGFDPRALTFKT